VGTGDVRRSQAASVVKDLMDASRQNRKELMRLVRFEVQSQMEGLGFATKRDFDKLERRIARLEADRTTPKAKKTPARKTTRKKTATKTGGGSVARRSGATKPPLAESTPTA
jgi:hypothetical protein